MTKLDELIGTIAAAAIGTMFVSMFLWSLIH